MSLIDSIIQCANEIGKTPDFVIRVSFWALIVIGIGLGVFFTKLLS